jgi:hypothetical protein
VAADSASSFYDTKINKKIIRLRRAEIPRIYYIHSSYTPTPRVCSLELSTFGFWNGKRGKDTRLIIANITLIL